MSEPPDPDRRLREQVQRETGKAREELTTRTPAGVTRKLLYGPADLEGVAGLGVPAGQAPYVRGARASMYGGRPWTIRQYAGFSTAEESNAFYKQSLAGVQRGLSLTVDVPNHPGY